MKGAQVLTAPATCPKCGAALEVKVTFDRFDGELNALLCPVCKLYQVAIKQPSAGECLTFRNKVNQKIWESA